MKTVTAAVIVVLLITSLAGCLDRGTTSPQITEVSAKNDSAQSPADIKPFGDPDTKIISETKTIENEFTQKISALPKLTLVKESAEEISLVINLNSAEEVYGIQIELLPASSISSIDLSQELDPISTSSRDDLGNKVVIYAFRINSTEKEFIIAKIKGKEGIKIGNVEYSNKEGKILIS